MKPIRIYLTEASRGDFSTQYYGWVLNTVTCTGGNGCSGCDLTHPICSKLQKHYPFQIPADSDYLEISNLPSDYPELLL